MTLFRNKDIGQISKAALLAALPESLPVRKGRNGALYMAGPWGAWYMNTASGQDFLLENSTLYGAEGAPDQATVPALPPAAPVEPGAPARVPDPDPPPEPKPKKRSFLDALGEFD